MWIEATDKTRAHSHTNSLASRMRWIKSDTLPNGFDIHRKLYKQTVRLVVVPSSGFQIDSDLCAELTVSKSHFAEPKRNIPVQRTARETPSARNILGTSIGCKSHKTIIERIWTGFSKMSMSFGLGWIRKCCRFSWNCIKSIRQTDIKLDYRHHLIFAYRLRFPRWLQIYIHRLLARPQKRHISDHLMQIASDILSNFRFVCESKVENLHCIGNYLHSGRGLWLRMCATHLVQLTVVTEWNVRLDRKHERCKSYCSDVHVTFWHL